MHDHLNAVDTQAKSDASYPHAEEKAAKKRKRIIAVAAPIAAACIAFAIVFATLIIPGNKLNKAKKLIGSGNYKAAYDLLDNFDYKNSRELRESIRPQYLKALISEAEIGSTVFFGAYEQDNDTADGKEEIEWIVLAKEGDRALVISKYALDCRLYHPSMSDVTWETCSLRKWLNGPFMDAFGDEERGCILDTVVTADANPEFNTPPGNDVTDKVFLLSITEACKYFGSDEARKCSATDYAKAQGVWKSSRHTTGGKSACWWLRSPGSLADHAAIVLDEGSVETDGRGVFNILGGIRPAMWIDLGAGN